MLDVADIVVVGRRHSDASTAALHEGDAATDEDRSSSVAQTASSRRGSDNVNSFIVLVDAGPISWGSEAAAVVVANLKETCGVLRVYQSKTKPSRDGTLEAPTLTIVTDRDTAFKQERDYVQGRDDGRVLHARSSDTSNSKRQVQPDC